jgi:Tat protein secretion system quality control protein TatD with DNase activity
LARLEARIALEELTQAVDRFERVDHEDLVWNDSFQLRAITRLPLIVHVRSAATDPVEVLADVHQVDDEDQGLAALITPPAPRLP